MDDLKFSLKVLCRRHPDGGHTTQADRLSMLTMMTGQLREMGFHHMRAASLKQKHVDALVKCWTDEGISAASIKNRLTVLRWWAKKIGKHALIPTSNSSMGVASRQYRHIENKACDLDPSALSRIHDEHVRAALELQREFGLTRQEAIKFHPRHSDYGGFILVKEFGGRRRTRRVPIITGEQRSALTRAQRLAGAGSLIPRKLRYVDQARRYMASCRLAGLRRMDGLRYRYAQLRYESITGWKPTIAGGHVALSSHQSSVKLIGWHATA